jgi:hypothetical protein
MRTTRTTWTTGITLLIPLSLFTHLNDLSAPILPISTTPHFFPPLLSALVQQELLWQELVP